MTYKSIDIFNVLKDKFPSANDFLNSLKSASKNVENNDDKLMRSYWFSYPVIVNYFRKIHKMNEFDLVAGLFMVYGWMPTEARYTLGVVKDNEELRKTLTVLRKLANPDKREVLSVLEKDDLKVVRKFANGSLPGMSKILHFVNPRVFPIYDSNLSQLFGFVSETSYIAYVKGFSDFCDDLEVCCKESNGAEFSKKTVEGEIDEILRKLEEKFGCPEGISITPVRAVEFILYNECR